MYFQAENVTCQDGELILPRKHTFSEQYKKLLYGFFAGLVIGVVLTFVTTYSIYYSGRRAEEGKMRMKGNVANVSAQQDNLQLLDLLNNTCRGFQQMKNLKGNVIDLLEDFRRKSCEQKMTQGTTTCLKTTSDTTTLPTTTSATTTLQTTTSGPKLKCKRYWKEFDGHCYYFSINKKSWHLAENECKRMNSNLVKIEDSRENRWISNQAGVYRSFWIGAHDIKVEDKWIWSVDSSEVTYTDWARGEPNEKDLTHDEDCAVLNWVRRGGWWDYICRKSLAYICEGNMI